MLKQLLSEIYEVLKTLDKIGYFGESKKKVKRHNFGPHSLWRRGKKLTHDEVLEIYNSKNMSAHELAEYFEVSETTIRHIWHGKTWSKLTGEHK